jgi:AraC family transcriptional regulator, transcriptional activator of pobA
MASGLLVKNKIDPDKLIQVAPFRKKVRRTTPHKHNNYFEIIYLSRGSGYHYIDSLTYKVSPPMIFFIRKEQVHYWDLFSRPDGHVIIIKKTFIERSLDSELKLLLAKLSRQSCLSLSKDPTLNALFNMLNLENNSDSDNAFHITEGLLKALLAKILDISKPVINKARVKADLFESLTELLSQEKTCKNSVAYYANVLNTTPQNLNAVCRKTVNQPAAEVLSEFIISEAKRLLLYTDNTISEISYELEFKDPSHFVKYFKRITGQTPKSFRRSEH